MEYTGKNTLDICFTVDEPYLRHACVALSSIIQNNPIARLRVYILFSELRGKSKEKFLKFCKKRGIELKLVRVEGHLTSGLKISGHGTRINYFRIFLPELLPELNKVLYLDSDIIVYSGIEELFKTDIESFSLAAVPWAEDTISSILNIDRENYFNSGVMLLNLEYWRRNSITEMLVSYILRNPEKITYWDQDALNAILHNAYLKLDKGWNYLGDDISHNELTHLPIRIIHFAGLHKPWNYYCTHPLKSEYYKYQALTPWRYFGPDRQTLWQRFVRFCF